MFGLFFVRDSPEYLWLGLLLIAMGSVFFEFAEVSYNGIMVRITQPDNVGKVSGFGWGMGYAGGLVLLVILLVLVIQPEVGLFDAGDEGGNQIPRRRRPLRGLVRDLQLCRCCSPRRVPRPPAPHRGIRSRRSSPTMPRSSAASCGCGRRSTRRCASSSPRLSSVTAWPRSSPSPGFSRQAAGLLRLGDRRLPGVAANVAAGAGAMIAEVFDDKLGPKPVIIAGLIIILIGGLPILFSDTAAVFWVCALVLSFCVGPVQASSRSFLARITPPERAGRELRPLRHDWSGRELPGPGHVDGLDLDLRLPAGRGTPGHSHRAVHRPAPHHPSQARCPTEGDASAGRELRRRGAEIGLPSQKGPTVGKFSSIQERTSMRTYQPLTHRVRCQPRPMGLASGAGQQLVDLVIAPVDPSTTPISSTVFSPSRDSKVDS